MFKYLIIHQKTDATTEIDSLKKNCKIYNKVFFNNLQIINHQRHHL